MPRNMSLFEVSTPHACEAPIPQYQPPRDLIGSPTPEHSTYASIHAAGGWNRLCTVAISIEQQRNNNTNNNNITFQRGQSMSGLDVIGKQILIESSLPSSCSMETLYSGIPPETN